MSNRVTSRFAILGLLTLKPMSGYDLKRFVDEAVRALRCGIFDHSSSDSVVPGGSRDDAGSAAWHSARGVRMRYCHLAVVGFMLIWSSGFVGATDYAESFDIVWETINERFFDSDFKGVDWSESRKHYRPKVARAEDDETFYTLINQMLFELGVSHLGVVPTDDPKQLGEAAIFGEGTIGIDIRLVDGRLFITRVEDGSPAAEKGLAVGYEVLRLNGRTLEEIATQPLESPTPPFTERNKRYMILGAVYWELLGPAGEQVSVEFRNRDGRIAQLRLCRQSRGAQRVFDEGMPPTYVTITSKRIDDDIGYIRFNSFHPALLESLMNSIDDLTDTKGMIIDLRGNPGGAFGVRHQLARRFVTERTVIWRYRGREGVDDIYLDPAERPYKGRLVILVDGASASSSEEFSGGLQCMGRATIVGERTPGRDVVADIMVLPVGAYFIFPVAETQTSEGIVLEHRGVIPDVESLFTTEGIGTGRDVQLDAAVEVLRGTAK